MTQDEIIALAEQAGVLVTIDEGGMWVMTEPGNEKQVMSFANLIIEAAALAEREACAKLCEEYDMDHIVGQQLAASIRARGDK